MKLDLLVSPLSVLRERVILGFDGDGSIPLHRDISQGTGIVGIGYTKSISIDFFHARGNSDRLDVWTILEGIHSDSFHIFADSY